MDAPVSDQTVSTLYDLVSKMFGPSNAVAAPAAGPGMAGGAPLPPGASPPLPPVRPDGGAFNGITMRQGGPSQGLPLQQPPQVLPDAASSTPTGQNQSTPQGQPQGRVLARVRDTTGTGALKGIEASKGKSKWGAFATGLAAGMSSQEAAQKEAEGELAKLLQSQHAMWKDNETLRQGDVRTQATANYYNGLANRGETTGSRTGGNARTITPEERAFRYAQAERVTRENLARRGLQGPALEAAVTQEMERFGARPPELPGSNEPDIQPPDGDQAWGDKPGMLGSILGAVGKNGWVAPTPTQQPPTLGNGQPVNVPPGAPRGTPKVQMNPAGLAAPKSKADFDALPSGTRFVDPDGVTRIKP